MHNQISMEAYQNEKSNSKDVDRNRIIMIVDERGELVGKLELLKQQAKIYQAKGTQDALFHLSIFSYHLILIALKQETEVVCQLVEIIRKLVMTPIIVLTPEYFETKSCIIHAGADLVLGESCTAEEIGLQAYALIRRYTKWKSEKAEEKTLTVGALEINVLQRTVSWRHKEIPVVKREFDFLYLLAATPGRVYSFSQIYRIIWKDEYVHGDIENIIYCMVHRLKQKLRKIDIKSADMICSVKEVGYCLKVHKEL